MTKYLGIAVTFLAAGSVVGQTVEFNRDIRPILSNNCFACHGPDKNQRKADLRLDNEKDALAKREGEPVLVPGQPAQSLLYQKIAAGNAKERMPPQKFGKQLTKTQIELVRRWIEQGAKWQKHWSLLPAQRPPLPTIPPLARGGEGEVNPIDRFVLARLHQEGLKPAPEADRRTLLRRLSFDLTGLPPTPEQVDAFLADTAPDAYEKQVDRLLASKHFGERLALYWLDVVRYADTGGYHSDNHRDISPYRDYVINAFNDNMPFDRFTIEQLAGDLLPPTPPSEGGDGGVSQKIASGFNRLLQTTEEGGAQAKEYLAKYAADRVRNTATIFLGATMGCAECHDHKFDPYTTKDFYSFAAFFADLKEKAVGRQEQDLLPTPEQAVELQRLDAQMAPFVKVLATATPELDAAQLQWEQALRAAGAKAKGLPREIVAILAVEATKRNNKQKQDLASYYRTIAPSLEGTRKQLAPLQAKKDAVLKTVPRTLISTAIAPRTMRILPRGNWLDDSGEIVTPAVPAALTPLASPPDRRPTRLDLAQWLTAPDNPMVARVFVNRLWKLAFGQGIVKSLDDFGSQGTWPSHPELLDWLAVEFVNPSQGGKGWDVKRLLTLIVTSRTYRQASQAGDKLRQVDPYNALLARQARYRLDAEMVRDNALAVSGLLARKVGGPSVKPYQPEGYWSFLNFPKRDWQKDQGEELYRRGLYTYWQRTFPHPSLLAFDAPSREECTVERPRSNTPLQALVLLNDPTYVEAARALAERVVRAGGGSAEERVHFACRQVLGRKAESEELKLLAALHAHHLRQYQADRKAAEALLGVGDHPAPKDIDAADLAAWASVARVILNLHETITRE